MKAVATTNLVRTNFQMAVAIDALPSPILSSSSFQKRCSLSALNLAESSSDMGIRSTLVRPVRNAFTIVPVSQEAVA